MRDNSRLLTWVFIFTALASAAAVIIAALVSNSKYQSPLAAPSTSATIQQTPQSSSITFLSDLSPRTIDAAGDNYCIGRDPVGDPPTCTGAKIEVQGTPYPHSLFAHADSTLVFELNGQYDTLVTSIVLQGGNCGDGASFRIELDGKEVFKSPIIQHEEIPHDIRIDVRNGYVLRLETDTGGNGDYMCDGTIWGEPYLISNP
jgi:hypothetical protein